MPFIELTGSGFRNLKSFKIKPSEKINIIYGANGAGKTNLLELIYLNSLGKSFRTSVNRSLIRDTEESCVVFSKYASEQFPGQIDRIGIEKHRHSKQKISINGLKDKTVAELAQIIPVLAIQPDELDLIDGPSSQRRSYLDWLLFHVEQDFYSCWKRNQKLLKQRNHLLRSNKGKPKTKTSSLELRAWDLQFIAANEEMSALRKPYIQALESVVNGYLSCFPAFENICVEENKVESFSLRIDFFQGWQENRLLVDVLEQDLVMDMSRGFTHSGGHRGDLLITVKQQPAKEYLSRGQKKLLALVMRLAQVITLLKIKKRSPILLIDDLFAELDEQSASIFCSLIESLDIQVFLTSLSDFENKNVYFKQEPRMFHVEQGLIKTL